MGAKGGEKRTREREINSEREKERELLALFGRSTLFEGAEGASLGSRGACPLSEVLERRFGKVADGHFR